NEAAVGSHRPVSRNGKVLNGIDVLEAENFTELREGRDVTRIGILTNQNGVDLDGRRTIDVLAAAPGIKVVSLFTGEHGISVVLDHPNPIGGVLVQGPVPDYKQTFVNYYPTPTRHGMTIGELAQMYNSELNINAKLTVVMLKGWQRGDWFDATNQDWMSPSPNM